MKYESLPNEPEEQIHDRPGVARRQAPVGVVAGEHAADGDVHHEDGDVAHADEEPQEERPAGPGVAILRGREDVQDDVDAEQDDDENGLGTSNC